MLRAKQKKTGFAENMPGNSGCCGSGFRPARPNEDCPFLPQEESILVHILITDDLERLLFIITAASLFASGVLGKPDGCVENIHAIPLFGQTGA